jgi:ATP-dependent Zn protease
MSDGVDLVALHEAGHAVVAAGMVGAVQVVSASAGAEAGVRTRYRPSASAEEAMAMNLRLAVVDLAGMAAEWILLRAAWKTDEENALRRCLGIVVLRRGLNPGADITAEMRKEAAELVEELREQAAVLVEERFAAIQRVAEALAGGATLDGPGVEALIAQPENNPEEEHR